MQLTNKDFDDGFKNKRFELHYQPIISLSSPLMLAAEAMVRWNHPDYNVLNPALFLTHLDRLGRTGELTRYVLREAAEACATAKRLGLDLSISINVSPTDLLDGTLPASIGLLVQEFGISKQNLIVEVPHYPLERPNARFLETMSKLRADGIATAAHLGPDAFSDQTSPKPDIFTHFKIGVQSVLEIEAREKEKGVDRVVQFLRNAHDNDITAIAVGAESPTSLSSIDQLGFAAVQGNYISPPIGFDDVIDWLGTWSDVITDNHTDTGLRQTASLAS